MKTASGKTECKMEEEGEGKTRGGGGGGGGGGREGGGGEEGKDSRRPIPAQPL